jgi:uncharacterized membrane protein YfcA
MVGKQGVIRSAAMLGFCMTRSEFVATGAAIALLIDAARAPVYLFTHGNALIRMWPLLALATAGTIAGTFAGTQILGRISERAFRQAVGATVLALGIATLVSAF